MNQIEVKGYAKINLSLDVVGKRENGYHEVEMIMQQITLYDLITLTKKEAGISIECNSKYVPDSPKNIAYKIAEDVINLKGISSGLHIKIEKNIPVAAGLAGGSADAAAVIKGMNQLFNLNMTMDEMKTISVKHGADIPFCVEGGAAVARGIGEALEKIPTLKNVCIVLCKPSIGVSTQEVYSSLKLEEIKRHPETDLLIQAMKNNDFRYISKNMYNVLEEVTAKKYKIIEKIENKMRSYGAVGTMMSGSGPTVFGIFKNRKTALSAEKNLKRAYKEVHLVTTYDGGNNE